jgi:hypothetical protein
MHTWEYCTHWPFTGVTLFAEVAEVSLKDDIYDKDDITHNMTVQTSSNNTYYMIL